MPWLILVQLESEAPRTELEDEEVWRATAYIHIYLCPRLHRNTSKVGIQGCPSLRNPRITKRLGGSKETWFHDRYSIHILGRLVRGQIDEHLFGLQEFNS